MPASIFRSALCGLSPILLAAVCVPIPSRFAIAKNSDFAELIAAPRLGKRARGEDADDRENGAFFNEIIRQVIADVAGALIPTITCALQIYKLLEARMSLAVFSGRSCTSPVQLLGCGGA